MNVAIDKLDNEFLDTNNRQINVRVQLPKLHTLNDKDKLFDAITG